MRFLGSSGTGVSSVILGFLRSSLFSPPFFSSSLPSFLPPFLPLFPCSTQLGLGHGQPGCNFHWVLQGNKPKSLRWICPSWKGTRCWSFWAMQEPLHDYSHKWWPSLHGVTSWRCVLLQHHLSSRWVWGVDRGRHRSKLQCMAWWLLGQCGLGHRGHHHALIVTMAWMYCGKHVQDWHGLHWWGRILQWRFFLTRHSCLPLPHCQTQIDMEWRFFSKKWLPSCRRKTHHDGVVGESMCMVHWPNTNGCKYEGVTSVPGLEIHHDGVVCEATLSWIH